MLNNYNEIDNVFFTDGYQLARQYLKIINKENIHRLTTALYENIDLLLIAFRNRIEKENMQVTCHKSCDYCCSQAVFSNQREVCYLVDYLRKNLSPKELIQLRKRAEQKTDKTKKLSFEKKLFLKHNCPLLIDHICIAYPARPLACRIYLSMDLQSCKRYYFMPEDKSSIAKLYKFPLHAGRMMNQGISQYITEQGINSNTLSLELALVEAFKSESPTSAWLNGEEIFTKPQLSEEELGKLSDFELNQ